MSGYGAKESSKLEAIIFTCLKEGKKKAQYWTNKGH